MTSEVFANPEVSSNIGLLSAWIESQMAYRGQPGLSVAISYNQELVWTKGFGYACTADKAPAASRTIYRIASITKLFTSTAILQLRDAGKLHLDDPMKKHLPWFDIQNRYPDAPPITIRHLITHTSGLPREAAFPYWTDSKFPTREQVREALSQQETILPTETRWKYSNLALSLAGEIVAAASGQEYPDYIEQNILQPLGMSDTYVRTIQNDHSQLATGYGRRMPDGSRSLSPFTDCQGITPAANMATTVKDLARFAMLQLRDGPAGGAQILRGTTLHEMHRIHWLSPDWEMGWGLGFRVERDHKKAKTYIGHGGSVKGFRTHMRICPADKIAVIVFANADDGDPLMYVDKVFDWVAPAIVKATTSEPVVATADPAWQKYLGMYRNEFNDTEVLVLNGELAMISPSDPDPMNGISKLVPVADGTFRIDTENGSGSHGELVVFDVDEHGKIRRMNIGANYTFPLTGEW